MKRAFGDAVPLRERMRLDAERLATEGFRRVPSKWPLSRVILFSNVGIERRFGPDADLRYNDATWVPTWAVVVVAAIASEEHLRRAKEDPEVRAAVLSMWAANASITQIQTYLESL